MHCGLKSQLAQLPSRLGMQLNLRLRSLYMYVLLLCLYVPYLRVVTTAVTKRIRPGGTPGGKHVFKMAS